MTINPIFMYHLLRDASQCVTQAHSSSNEGENMYTKPAVTVVGDFKDLTKGAGKAREKDLLGFRALIVIHWPWS